MGQNNFILDLIAGLKKAASTKQIKSDIKQIEDQGLRIKITGFLDKVKTRAQLKKDISNIEVPVKLTGKLDKSKTNAQLKQDSASLKGTVNLTGKVNKKGIVTSVQQATQQAQNVAQKKSIQVGFSLRKDKLVNDIKAFGQQNSKMFKDDNISAKYSSLLDNAKLATSNKELKNLRLQLSAMRSEIKATNLSGMTLGDAFKKTFKRATELFTGTGGVMLLAQQTRLAWTEALNLDKAYTDLIKVQDELSRGDYPEYLERCNKKAQELATTQQALIESATEFSRSGYNLTDSNALAEQAQILSNVGDMSASDSAKAIISGVQAYDIIDGYEDVEKKAEALIDKYNEIGNTASITTSEIAEGVQSVGSVFADANTSVDEFIALLAAGNRQYQNADSLALGLRTAALRIRGCTVELEEMGEETDGVYTSASKLQEKIADLTNINGNGGVKILESDGETFRSIYDIFLDISKVYKDMSDVDQSALLELISGKHRASAISATLNNMGEAQEIYQRSLESTGSAQEEYDKYLQSSEAALNRFKSSMTETYQSVLNGETVTGILNCGNATLQFANSIGLVESTLKGLVAIGIVKAITTLSAAFKASAISASNFGTALNTVKNMSTMARGTTEYANALQILKVVSAGLSDVQLKQVLSSKALSDADRIAILRTTGLTKAQAQAKLAQMGLTQSTKAQTTANASATASTFSLTAAVKGFGVSLKAAFMSKPVGISIMALSTIIGAVSGKISEYNQKMEEARQANIDAATTASEKAKELNDLYTEYSRLASISDRTSSQEEKFNEIVKDVTKSLGDKSEVLKGLTAGTDEYTESLKKATKAELENYYATAVTGRKAAEEELQKTVYDSWNGSKITIQMNTQMTGVENHMKALESVRDLLSKFEDDGRNGKEWEPINWDENKKDMDAVVEYYNALIEARKKLIMDAQATNDDTLLDSDIYKDIDSTINMLSEDVQTYIEKKYEELKLEYEMQNGIPGTTEEYNKMKQSLLDSSDAGEYFNNTISEMLTSDFTDLENGIQDVADSANNLKEQLEDSYISFSFTEEQTKAIDDFESKLKTLSTTLSSLKDGSYQESGFADLVKDFPELQGQSENLEQAITDLIYDSLQKLYDTLGTDLPDDVKNSLQAMVDSASGASVALDKSFSSIQKSYEALNDFKNAMNDDTLTDSVMNAVAGLSDNLNNLVAGFHAGTVSADELYSALLSHYNTDLENYSKALLEKNKLSTDFYNSLGLNDADVVNTFVKNYGIDLQNCQNYAEAKKQIELSTLSLVAGNWQRYYNIQTNTLTAEYSKLEAGAKNGDAYANKILDQINKYRSAMSQLDSFSFTGIEASFKGISSTFKANAEKIKNTAKDTAKEVEKAAEEAMKKAKEYVEAYIEYQKSLLESGKIDFKTYSNNVSNMLNDMFAQGKIAAKDYYTYTKTMLKTKKDVYDGALSAVLQLFDTEIENIDKSIEAIEKENDALEDQKTQMENAASAVADYYQDKIDAIEKENEEIDKQNELLEEQLSNMDKTISAIVNHYDSLIEKEQEHIDSIKEQNDDIQEQISKYDSLINVADSLYENEQNRLKDEQNAIQEKIDLLQDENDELDLQYRKSLALYELQRAQQQRTKKVYTGGDKGYVYTTDQSAISEAQKNIQDIQTEELVSSLNKEKDALQESIDSIQKYRDSLSEISKSYDDLIDQRNVIEMLGEEYENKILGTNIDDWIQLKDRYIEANDEITDNTKLIKSYEEKINVWEKEKESWSSLTQSIEDDTNKQIAIEQLGADWEQLINEGRFNALDGFKNRYVITQNQINDNENLKKSNDEKKIYYQDLKDQWSSLSNALSIETNKQAAIKQFGVDWEQRLNNGQLMSFSSYKDQYLGIQRSISDNKSIIDSYNEKKSYYENLKSLWGDITSEYEKERNRLYAAQLLGADWESDVLSGRLGRLQDFKDSYIQLQKDILDASVKIAEATLTEASTEQTQTATTPTTTSTTSSSNQDKKDKRKKETTFGITKEEYNNAVNFLRSGFGSNQDRKSAEEIVKKYKEQHKYASGTTHAKKGLNLVGEDGIETFIDNDGNISLVTEPTLIPMEGGEIVKNESETKSLLNGSNLIPLQTSDLFNKLSVNMPDLSSMFKINIPDYSNLVMRNNNIQQPSIVIGDIILNEVQNVDGLANAIIRELPNRVTQALGKR